MYGGKSVNIFPYVVAIPFSPVKVGLREVEGL